MSDTERQPGALLAAAADIDQIDFDKRGGVVVVVAQDVDDGRVLMVAEADREAFVKTFQTGQMWYRSRSRGLWHKGATTGHVQRVIEMRLDCDGDVVLALVRPAGPACHSGEVSCFGAYGEDMIARLDTVIEQRVALPQLVGSYTAKLLADRNLRLKKLGEEANESTVACADGDPAQAAEEAADLLYHTAVALHGAGTTLSAARRVLAARASHEQ